MAEERSQKDRLRRELLRLYQARRDLYHAYLSGALPYREYLRSVIPLDEQIDALEMSLLRDAAIFRKGF